MGVADLAGADRRGHRLSVDCPRLVLHKGAGLTRRDAAARRSAGFSSFFSQASIRACFVSRSEACRAKGNDVQTQHLPPAHGGVVAVSGVMRGPVLGNTPKLDGREASLRDMMLAAIPRLRAFAISLCGNAERADDLVQETLLRALAHMDAFRPGSMIAWLITILRNVFLTEWRKGRREIPDVNGSYAAKLTSQPAQAGGLEFGQLLEALGRLPIEQREPIILVGVSGLSYEQAAEICECAVGTVKSRVHRGRIRLAELLSM
jgi:RNA polymerase sigma-70 factor (ECF subfamily)